MTKAIRIDMNDMKEMTERALEGFNRNLKVRVRSNANGYSVKIGSKSFLTCQPNSWDCERTVFDLGECGLDISLASKDLEDLM